ncbi:MAG: hypothetical protein MSH35_04095 [Lactobacillus amylovorus]|nr:hypothetical protein [Lactobacillus amylovorus]
MWIYGILGAVTGITNDAALSYYKIVAPHLISGLNIFNAATAILMSIIIATVHKWGYRKILFILPPMTAIFMALMKNARKSPYFNAGMDRAKLT